MKKSILVIIFLCCMFAENIYAQSKTLQYDGWWNGVLSIAGQNIKMEFYIESSNEIIAGKMNAQGIKGIPVAVTAEGGAVTLEVKQLGMKYSAVYMGSSLMGTFEQNGLSAPLILYSGKLPVNRPQNPKAPFPYKTREVVFENREEGSRLAGTLTLAENPNKGTLVVMVTGSGTQNRDEEVYDHKPFAVIADFFARNGISTFRYDDRGAGESTGPLDGITTRNNAADAKSAVEYVRGLGEFQRIGVLGHSEGGIIALMLAGEQLTDFIISLAGVAISGKECLLLQNIEILQQKGVPEQMAKDYGKLLDGIYTERIARYRSNPMEGGAIPEGQKFVQDFTVTNGISLPANLIVNAAKVASHKNLWIDWMVAYDPSEIVGKIKCPVMAINGDMDFQVPAEENLERLQKLLPHNNDHFIKKYPALNHLFQECNKETALQYGEIEQTISPLVLEDIVKWVNGLE